MSDRKLRVLIVDDDEEFLRVLATRVESWGYDVTTASDTADARVLIEDEDPDLVLSDVRMPGDSGLALLLGAGRGVGVRPVILMTAHGTVDVAVEAMKKGARDFLTKPLDLERLGTLLEEVGAALLVKDEIRRTEAALDGVGEAGALIGTSPAMQEVFAVLRRLAGSRAAAVVTGEPGAGKETMARIVHHLSPRRGGPFVVVNPVPLADERVEHAIFGCRGGGGPGAADRVGALERARGGTLLLDELDDLPYDVQEKLVDVVERGSFRPVGGDRSVEADVRFLGATARMPREAVMDGTLSPRLHYALAVLTLEVPPLRERPGDVVPLARHFLRHFNRTHRLDVAGLSTGAADALTAFGWPGNVRELRRVVERAAVLAGSGEIAPEHLPPEIVRGEASGPTRVVLPVGITAAAAEKRLILATLDRTGNNKSEAARRLGLDVKTIRNKLKRYGIDR